MKIHIGSEISKLKKVLIHKPGKEIELVTPRDIKKQNFIDIVHYEGALSAHNQLKSVLEQVGVKVKLLEDELVKTLKNKVIRDILIAKTLESSHNDSLKTILENLNTENLAQVLLRGLKSSPSTLTDYLVNKKYAIAPLPNLVFVRDIAMVYDDSVVVGSMAKPSRQREVSIIKAILGGNFDFKDSQMFVNGYSLKQNEDFTRTSINNDFRIEGGDFHVLNKHTIAIGLSERTSSTAIDKIIENLFIPKLKGEEFNVIVVPLPPSTSTIHLDMVFSQINHDEAVVFPPVIMKPWDKSVIRIHLSKSGVKSFYEYNSAINAFKDAGVDINPILCANGEPIYQQREQWSSACNFFAFAPGKILGYDFNLKTLEALSKNGYEVVSAENFIAKKRNIDTYKKLVITINGSEMARGSGGCRCMTMPLERDENEI